MERTAGIYTRISRLSGAERNKEGAGLGVTRQREDCESLASNIGWNVADVYVDDDTSAYNGKLRKEYDRLLADIEAGRVDAVLTWHTDRLHRSPAELENYIDICEPRGVVTETVKAGHLDLATPTGRMVARQLGVVARYEVEHMAERQQRHKTQAAANGRFKGGRRPFGFEPDGVTIRPSEAAEIITASEAALSGVSLHNIAADLNYRKVTTSTGSAFTPTAVRRILWRARNAGLMVHRGKVIGLAAWPAIVDEETWRALDYLLSDPARRNSTTSARRWLGAGIYRCGICGGPLRSGATGGSGRKRQEVYRCPVSKHVARKAVNIDSYIQNLIIERLSRPDAAAVLPSSKPGDHTPQLRARAATLRSRLDALWDEFGDGDMDPRRFKTADEKLRAKLADVESQLSARRGPHQALARLVDADDVAAAWHEMSLGWKRAVLQSLMTVTVNPAPRGRPRGWQPGDSYFDPDMIDITWHRG